MIDVYAAGNDGAHCHSITNVKHFVFYWTKMPEDYIGVDNFWSIGAFKHFVAYLVRSFGHPGGYLKKSKVSINRNSNIKFETESVLLSCFAVLFLQFFGSDFGCSCTGQFTSNTNTFFFTEERSSTPWVTSGIVPISLGPLQSVYSQKVQVQNTQNGPVWSGLED